MAFVGTDSGRRLARLLDLPSSEALLDHFLMVNLYRDPAPAWNRAEAERRAAALCRCVVSPCRVSEVVLFSSPVARAFGLTYHPLLTWHRRRLRDGALVDFAVCPHPSGLTRWWNDPLHREAARAFFRALCGCPATPVTDEPPEAPGKGVRGRRAPGRGTVPGPTRRAVGALEDCP